MSSTDLPRPLLLPDIYFSLNTICQDKARGNIYLLSHLTATLYSRLKASERPLLKYWLCHLTGCVTLGKFTPLQKGANTTYLKMSLYQLHEKMYVTSLASSKYLIALLLTALWRNYFSDHEIRFWRILSNLSKVCPDFLLQSIHYSKNDAFCLHGTFNKTNQKYFNLFTKSFWN